VGAIQNVPDTWVRPTKILRSRGEIVRLERARWRGERTCSRGISDDPAGLGALCAAARTASCPIFRVGFDVTAADRLGESPGRVLGRGSVDETGPAAMRSGRPCNERALTTRFALRASYPFSEHVRKRHFNLPALTTTPLTGTGRGLAKRCGRKAMPGAGNGDLAWDRCRSAEQRRRQRLGASSNRYRSPRTQEEGGAAVMLTNSAANLAFRGKGSR